MEASEFRIGNYIYQKQGSWGEKLQTVTGTFLNKFSQKHAVEMCRYVPINADWLMRLGFKPDVIIGEVICYKKGLISVVLLKDDIKGVHVGMISVAIQRIDDGEKIKYVHQLQNLYHAVTLSELTINKSVEI